MRLYVLVEGQTEETFVRTLLAKHLEIHGVSVRAIVVETSRDAYGRKRRGGGRWARWLRDLKRLTAEQKQNSRFTTMFDLYGLPPDFPEGDACSAISDTTRRADALQDAMARAVDDWRLIPYLQRHEFEALVLAALDSLAGLLADDDLEGLARLRAEIGPTPPEDVNDGTDTAPSKRLERCIPGYRKTVHGPLTLEDATLSLLKTRCPRFGGWVTTLEKLGNEP